MNTSSFLFYVNFLHQNILQVVKDICYLVFNNLEKIKMNSQKIYYYYYLTPIKFFTAALIVQFHVDCLTRSLVAVLALIQYKFAVITYYVINCLISINTFCLLKCPYSCFSSHFCFLVISILLMLWRDGGHSFCRCVCE